MVDYDKWSQFDLSDDEDGVEVPRNIEHGTYMRLLRDKRRRDRAAAVRSPAPLPALVPTLLREHPAIARFFEDGIEQHGHAARRGPGLLGQFGMELRKLRQGRAGSLGDARNPCRHGGRFQKAAPLVPRPRQQPVE